MHTFSLHDLPRRSAELARDAQAGRVSLVTQDGEPIFLAVPFDDALRRTGVNVALAVKLFDEEVLSLHEGARLAGMTLAEFMEECSAREVPVVRYSAEELRRELADFDDLPRRR
jgi:predicted HTH domain antitoxin